MQVVKKLYMQSLWEKSCFIHSFIVYKVAFNSDLFIIISTNLGFILFYNQLIKQNSSSRQAENGLEKLVSLFFQWLQDIFQDSFLHVSDNDYQ